jgi:hypothetical protein
MNFRTAIQEVSFAMNSIPFSRNSSSLDPLNKANEVQEYLLPAKMLPQRIPAPITLIGYDEQPIREFYSKVHRYMTPIDLHENLSNYTHFVCTQKELLQAAISVYNELPGIMPPKHLRDLAEQFRERKTGFRRWLRWPATTLSKSGQRILYIEYFAYSPGHELTLISLLEHILHHAWEYNYELVSISVNHKDSILNKLLR